MKLCNARVLCDKAAERGYGVPALNTNGATYDIARAIIEAAEELHAPLIIQCYEPNLEYRGFDYFGLLARFLAAECTIPVAIALDHGSSTASVMRAVKAGFTAVMIDHASLPVAENGRGTRQVVDLMRPLGISVEGEVGHIGKATDGRAPATAKATVAEVKEYLALADVDLLAIADGTSHGVFDRQPSPDFELIAAIARVSRVPLVQHGTCGVSLADIGRCVKSGIAKVNFGEALRMNYIRYFNEFSSTLDHQHHAWKIMQASMERLKADIKEIIRACGAEGKAG